MSHDCFQWILPSFLLYDSLSSFFRIFYFPSTSPLAPSPPFAFAFSFCFLFLLIFWYKGKMAIIFPLNSRHAKEYRLGSFWGHYPLIWKCNIFLLQYGIHSLSVSLLLPICLTVSLYFQSQVIYLK